jgi:outer membrane protein TolC
MVANRDLLQRAVETHQRTVTDLAASQAAADDAHQAVIAADGELRRARIALNRAIGLPPQTKLALRPLELPAGLTPPLSTQLLADLETRRLDLLALHKGYDSQDATLRAAILAQFPKINLGFNTARDTSDVRTVGVGATIDIPIFDRNQGVIATETATRQKLFDEYASRVFEARADVAAAVVNIESLNEQLKAVQAALPVLENLVRTYQQAERRGDVDALSLYSAQNTLLQKKIDVAKLKQQLMQNWVALEIAAGQFLPYESTRTTTTTTTRPSTQPTEVKE